MPAPLAQRKVAEGGGDGHWVSLDPVPGDGKNIRGTAVTLPPLLLNHVPDFRGDVRPAKARDGADAGWRGHVDFGEVAVDDVDADEQQSALAQRRTQCFADFALARG